MPAPTKSGIQTTADGSSYIPSSQRADGSTRKAIRVRPGYRPPEDVETYKNRSAEAWKNRGSGGVPGAYLVADPTSDGAPKSKNAKRREAARQKASAQSDAAEDQLATALQETTVDDAPNQPGLSRDASSLPVNETQSPDEADKQKKIRNQLKKLKAVRELRDKRAAGEKLSHDQIVKIGKEDEILRDLRKLGYDGSELLPDPAPSMSDPAS